MIRVELRNLWTANKLVDLAKFVFSLVFVLEASIFAALAVLFFTVGVVGGMSPNGHQADRQEYFLVGLVLAALATSLVIGVAAIWHPRFPYRKPVFGFSVLIALPYGAYIAAAMLQLVD